MPHFSELFGIHMVRGGVNIFRRKTRGTFSELAFRRSSRASPFSCKQRINSLRPEIKILMNNTPSCASTKLRCKSCDYCQNCWTYRGSFLEKLRAPDAADEVNAYAIDQRPPRSATTRKHCGPWRLPGRFHGQEDVAVALGCCAGNGEGQWSQVTQGA